MNIFLCFGLFSEPLSLSFRQGRFAAKMGWFNHQPVKHQLVSPLSRATLPFQMDPNGLSMAYKFRLLSTYIHWDDPPCRPHFLPYFGGSLPELLWLPGTAGTSLGAVCMRLSKHRAARFLKLKTTGGKTFFGNL